MVILKQGDEGCYEKFEHCEGARGDDDDSDSLICV